LLLPLLAKNPACAIPVLHRRRALVAENDPYLAPGGSKPNREPSTGKPAGRPTMTMSRIILLVLLVVCLGMLGIDLVRGRMPLWSARGRLLAAMTARSPADDEVKPAAKGPIISGDISPLTADEVHKIVGREPSKTETQPPKLGESEQFVETYVYPGVFQHYTLKCSYYKTPKSMGGSALKRVE
jgi:hypothetical protein